MNEQNNGVIGWPDVSEKSGAVACQVDVFVMPKTRNYTEALAKKGGMHYSTDRCCPECGCPWYGNKNDCGEGHRTCCDCYQEWWMDIDYEHQAPRRELPAA